MLLLALHECIIILMKEVYLYAKYMYIYTLTVLLVWKKLKTFLTWAVETTNSVVTRVFTICCTIALINIWNKTNGAISTTKTARVPDVACMHGCNTCYFRAVMFGWIQVYSNLVYKCTYISIQSYISIMCWENLKI